MKKIIFILCLLLCFNIFSQDDLKREQTDRKVFAHGPRFGFTGIYDFNTSTWGVSEEDSSLLSSDIPPVISQFGYHCDLSIFLTDHINPLVQFDGLIGGIENGFFLPSLTMITGFRLYEVFEIGFGPNLSLSGVGYALALGYNIKVENVYFPINLAIVTSGGKLRASMLAGFNFP